MNKRELKDWVPYGKNILVELSDEENNILEVEDKKRKLIAIDQVSNKELLNLGLNSKEAISANRGGEDQPEYKVVAIGPKVDPQEVGIGDTVLFKPAFQSIAIKINDRYYMQAEEFWVAGHFKKNKLAE